MNEKKSVWNLPNKLTLTRALMIPVFVALFMLDGALPYARIFAEAVFVLASVTDWADGYIARKYNLITNLGKFMDPLADKLLVCAALVMLCGVGELPGWAVVLVLSREFIVTGFRVVAASKGVVIAAGSLGKFKTVSQMVTLIIMIPGVFTNRILIYGILGAVIALTAVSGVEYIVTNIKVLGED